MKRGVKIPEQIEEGADEAPQVISFEKEAVGYIEDELAQGYGLDQIKKELLEEGYPEAIIGKATAYVEKEHNVSKKDKAKDVPKTEEHHVNRRFHLPMMAIAAMVLVLIAIFFLIGIGGEEETAEAPERIDIFLYDNLGITPGTQDIAGSSQIYLRDELVHNAIAENLLQQNKANNILSKLKVSDAVKGFEKKATAYTLVGNGIQQKTLVEMRFQAERDVQVLKIVESIPKTVAVAEEIILTQGGVIAEKDPILIFTFTNVRSGEVLKSVYVINKELSSLETMTFAAEEEEKVVKEVEFKVCGDKKCVQGESYRTCCIDCGCPADFICENNICIGAEKDECSGNADCDDDDVSTSDTCSGTPKKCEHAPITDCVSGDDYCPPGCTYVNDGDCEQIIEAEEQAEEEIDVSGLNITGDQESPDIYDITITPVNVTIGEEMLVEARVIDANGKDDIARVWFEILELAQSHGEIEDMNDAGADGDGAAGDDVYTALRIIDQYYLEGYYHLTVFAQDHAGNKKKSQTMFRVTVPEE